MKLVSTGGAMRVLWLLLVAALGTQESLGSRVLMLTPIAFKSHTIFYRGLAKALVEHGHQVTQVLPYNNSAASGVREVVLPVPNINDIMSSVFNYGMMGFMSFATKGQDICVQALTCEDFSEIRKEDFDVVLYSEWMCPCFYEYISQLKVPFVLIQALGLDYSVAAWSIGNPFFSSFVPNLFLDHFPRQDGLPYWQRMCGVLLDTVFFTFSDHLNMKHVIPGDLKSRGICSEECSDLHAIRRNASLMIINSFKTLERVAQPYVPAVIHAGGIHLNKVKPLPQYQCGGDLWDIGGDSEGFGVITITMILRLTRNLTGYTRLMLVKVLGSLKQRVLWKWDKDNMEDLPSNIRISKWLPQQDILSHPKLQLFMTHGGLHSTQEAFYNGVPVLGFPVFADQSMNMAAIENQGWGRVINWKGLTEDHLREALLDIINNPRYRVEAQRQQRIARDQLISPQETVNYWVDYVIRHNGARHLDSPIKWMPWYKLYNADVWVVLISSLFLTLGFIFKLLICSYNCCRRRLKKKND
ncbi:unnamed protein product, partial [Meganyctiphanes norvegica]